MSRPMIVREISDTNFTGYPPEGEFIVLCTEEVQRVCGLPPELLPSCRRCGASTLVDGVITNKHIDLRDWDNLRVWCRPHVPLRVRLMDAVRGWDRRLMWRLWKWRAIDRDRCGG